MITVAQPCQASVRLRPLIGEPWNAETWGAWLDALLFLAWEGAGHGPMPDEWHEWDSFRGEWVRALLQAGKEDGFVMAAKR